MVSCFFCLKPTFKNLSLVQFLKRPEGKNFSFTELVLYRLFNAAQFSDENDLIVFDKNENGQDILVIESVGRAQAGEYSCQVENDLGTGIAEPITIDVLCKLNQTIRTL